MSDTHPPPGVYGSTASMLELELESDDSQSESGLPSLSESSISTSSSVGVVIVEETGSRDTHGSCKCEYLDQSLGFRGDPILCSSHDRHNSAPLSM